MTTIREQLDRAHAAWTAKCDELRQNNAAGQVLRDEFDQLLLAAKVQEPGFWHRGKHAKRLQELSDEIARLSRRGFTLNEELQRLGQEWVDVQTAAAINNRLYPRSILDWQPPIRIVDQGAA